MVRVTNPKVGGIAPAVWRPYPGVSVLYDDEACASALSGVEPLERLTAARDHNDSLYGRLRAVADEVAVTARREELALALVPQHTYHVTLCDGVNEGVRTVVRPDRRREVAATLDALPDSLLWPNSIMRLLRDRELRWSVWTNPITFRVKGLSVWGHALIARMVPASEESLIAKARHEAARSQLVGRLGIEIGVPVQEWRPHVTLGYFANEDEAERARDSLVPECRVMACRHTHGTSVSFCSASLYAFTDMVTYWRLGH